MLFPQELDVDSSRGGQALCGALRRLPCVTALTLAIRRPRGAAASGSGGSASASSSSSQPGGRDAAALASALSRLGQAAGGKLLKLAVLSDVRGTHSDALPTVSPAALQALGSHFPHLTHLRLGPCKLEGDGEGWAAALALLPRSLVWLRCDPVARAGGDPAIGPFLDQLQQQVLRLPALSGLQLWFGEDPPLRRDEGYYVQPNFRPLSQALNAAGASTLPLRNLTLGGLLDAGACGGVPPLAVVLSSPQLASSLRSLAFPGSPPLRLRRRFGALLKGLPMLQHLELGQHFQSGDPGLWQALCTLQHLTSLALLPSTLTSCSRGSQAALPASLSSLRLHGFGYGWDGLGQLLQLVPPHCAVVVCGGCTISTENAVAALTHPGGVSLELQSLDPVTHDPVALQVSAT